MTPYKISGYFTGTREDNWLLWLSNPVSQVNELEAIDSDMQSSLGLHGPYWIHTFKENEYIIQFTARQCRQACCYYPRQTLNARSSGILTTKSRLTERRGHTRCPLLLVQPVKKDYWLGEGGGQRDCSYCAPHQGIRQKPFPFLYLPPVCTNIILKAGIAWTAGN